MQAEPIIVSIIMPTYNRSKVLLAAIDSIRAQSFCNWELIIVDDGSTDDTCEIVARYMVDDLRIRYVYQKNERQAAARNKGLSLACGEYIAFLDSDDQWLPEKLEKQIALFRQYPNAGMVYCNQLICKNGGESFQSRYTRGQIVSGNIFNYLLTRKIYCSTQSIMIRRSIIDQVGGFDEALKNSLEDWEWTLRVARSYEIRGDSTPLVKRYINYSYSPDYALVRMRNHKYILEKTFADADVSVELQKTLWRGAWFSWGHSLLIAGYYLKSFECFWKALFLGHSKALPGLVLSMSGPLGRKIVMVNNSRFLS